MRQEKDDATLPHPLGLSAGDELVDDALRSVGKVTKLSLPEHQGVGVSHGVAQLKACKQASMAKCPDQPMEQAFVDQGLCS